MPLLSPAVPPSTPHGSTTPSSSPPAAPGAVYYSVITVRFTIAGTVEAFDPGSFRSHLLALYSNAVDASLDVQPASVAVTASLIYDDAAAANSDYAAIAASNATYLQAALGGITIEAMGSSSLSEEAFDAPLPPQPPPPSPTVPLFGPSDPEGMSLVFPLVAATVAVILMAIILIIGRLRHKRLRLGRILPEPNTTPGPPHTPREESPPMPLPESSSLREGSAEHRWHIDPSRLTITAHVLGRGAMGVVRLAHLDGKMPVAVKLLHSSSSLLAANVEKELKTLALATVHCTHVCRLIGTCTVTSSYSSFPEMGGAADAIALVMKKYECTLTDLLGAEPDRRFPAQMAIRVGAQLAKAIDELHELKILIRDLKPSNILFDKYGGLVVSDFGISVQLGESVTHMMPTSVQGTVAYMSPEALDPDMYGGLGMPSDIWALGCCVIEMLSGEQPFSGVPYHQIMRRVCDRREAPEVPPGLLEPELEQLLTRCVSHDPNSRPSAAEAHRAFNEMATGVRQQEVAPRASAGAEVGIVLAPATDSQERSAAADNGGGAIQRQVQPSTAGGANKVGVGASDNMDSDSALIEIRAETPFVQARQTPSDPTLELLTLRIARLARAGSTVSPPE